MSGDDIYLAIGDDGGVALRHLVAPTRKEGFFAGCPQPARAGNVLLRLLLPETGVSNDQGVFGHASVRIEGGTLAATPAAACLTERFAALLAEAELPKPVGGFLRYESWTLHPGRPPTLGTP